MAKSTSRFSKVPEGSTGGSGGPKNTTFGVFQDDEAMDRKISMMKKTGEYMNIFVCFKCRDSLFGKRFVKLDRKPWCVLCYNDSYSQKCEKCSGVIDVDKEDIQYGNYHWHLSCFRCYQCDKSLFQKTFGAIQNNLYCSDCFFHFCQKWCVACNKPLKGGHRMITYQEEFYHKECFVCCRCSKVVDTDDFKVRENQRYCSKCYAECFAPKCVKCKDIIEDFTVGVTHNEMPYHKKCLLCHECGTELCEVRYFDFEGTLHCYDCFENPSVFGKTCVGCNERITDAVNSTNFYSVDHDSYWHDPCFQCHRCMDKLDPGKTFVCTSKTEGQAVEAYCEACGVEVLTDSEALVLGRFKTVNI